MASRSSTPSDLEVGRGLKDTTLNLRRIESLRERLSDLQAAIDTQKAKFNPNQEDLATLVKRRRTYRMKLKDLEANRSDTCFESPPPTDDPIPSSTPTTSSSPLQSIPLEILGEIFGHVVLCPRDFEKRPLVELGLVCKYWREATLRTPHLWAQLTIVPLLTTTALETAVTWLRRALHAPKTLEIRGDVWHGPFLSPQCTPDACTLTRPLLLMLLEEVAPVRHLVVRCSSERCLEHFFATLRKFPNGVRVLRSVSSLSLSFSKPSKGEGSGDASAGAPASPEEIYSDLDLAALSVNIPWGDNPTILNDRILKNLTFLSIDTNLHSQAFASSLAKCRNLEVLSVKNPWRRKPQQDDAPAFSPEKRVLLPKLRALYLVEASDIELLDYLDVPVLTELDISFRTFASPRYLPLKDFVDRHKGSSPRVSVFDYVQLSREVLEEKLSDASVSSSSST